MAVAKDLRSPKKARSPRSPKSARSPNSPNSPKSPKGPKGPKSPKSADGAKKNVAGREWAAWFSRRLAKAYPDARCTLDFTTPLELYVATVLSAQCTDARVNQVTPRLFAQCCGPEDYLALTQAGLEKEIQSTGFFRNKAKSILGGCARFVEGFGGLVPSTMEELLTVPGVGRKTANVILGNAFGKPEGFVVDTHVSRLTQRLGLTTQKDPVKIERDLLGLFPRKDWTVLAHRLILHGRKICVARAPRCPICPLLERCSYGLRYSVGRAQGPERTEPAARKGGRKKTVT